MNIQGALALELNQVLAELSFLNLTEFFIEELHAINNGTHWRKVISRGEHTVLSRIGLIHKGKLTDVAIELMGVELNPQVAAERRRRQEVEKRVMDVCSGGFVSVGRAGRDSLMTSQNVERVLNKLARQGLLEVHHGRSEKTYRTVGTPGTIAPRQETPL